MSSTSKSRNTSQCVSGAGGGTAILRKRHKKMSLSNKFVFDDLNEIADEVCRFRTLDQFEACETSVIKLPNLNKSQPKQPSLHENRREKYKLTSVKEPFVQ